VDPAMMDAPGSLIRYAEPAEIADAVASSPARAASSSTPGVESGRRDHAVSGVVCDGASLGNRTCPELHDPKRQYVLPGVVTPVRSAHDWEITGCPPHSCGVANCTGVLG